jgi:four helix bundle protein
MNYPLSSAHYSGFLLSDRIEDTWSPGPILLRETDRSYDLHERTAKFGEAVLLFVKRIPDNAVNRRLISQLVGCATSLGANYCEADEAVSRKDFCLKIAICRKEARETQFFLRMMATAEDRFKDEARKLWREARELHLIFCAILRNSKGTSYKMSKYQMPNTNE